MKKLRIRVTKEIHTLFNMRFVEDISMYQIRTDLALETQEKMQQDHVDLKGSAFWRKRSGISL